MEIYNYHPLTKQFISQTIADESPLEPGVFLIPANCTMIAPPVFDAEKQICTFENNKWTISDIPEPEPEPEPEPKDYTAENQEALWQAATAYEQSYISGSAVGDLTIGVIQRLPKSMEIKFWIENIWMNHYYPRKSVVPSNRMLTNEEKDFSLVGPMPYSVPELVEEVNQHSQNV
jgi:hypothetical protein